LIRIGDVYTPFAGIGLDASVLRDYEFVRERLNTISGFTEKFRGVVDYAAAIFFLSIPRYLITSLPNIVIKNGNDVAYKLDFEGNKEEAILPGTVIYEGPMFFCCAATIKYYGWGWPLFPQANALPGTFNLRFTDMGMSEFLTELPKIIRQRFLHEKLYDYACTDISVSSPASLHIGGDLQKRRESNETSMSVEEFEVIRGSKSSPREPM